MSLGEGTRGVAWGGTAVRRGRAVAAARQRNGSRGPWGPATHGRQIIS